MEKIKEQEEKDKAPKQPKGNTLESTHYVFSYYNIGFHEDVFNITFPTWRDTWLLDIGATNHM